MLEFYPHKGELLLCQGMGIIVSTLPNNGLVEAKGETSDRKQRGIRRLSSTFNEQHPQVFQGRETETESPL